MKLEFSRVLKFAISSDQRLIQTYLLQTYEWVLGCLDSWFIDSRLSWFYGRNLGNELQRDDDFWNTFFIIDLSSSYRVVSLNAWITKCLSHIRAVMPKRDSTYLHHDVPRAQMSYQNISISLWMPDDFQHHGNIRHAILWHYRILIRDKSQVNLKEPQYDTTIWR